MCKSMQSEKCKYARRYDNVYVAGSDNLPLGKHRIRSTFAYIPHTYPCCLPHTYPWKPTTYVRTSYHFEYPSVYCILATGPTSMSTYLYLCIVFTFLQVEHVAHFFVPSIVPRYPFTFYFEKFRGKNRRSECTNPWKINLSGEFTNPPRSPLILNLKIRCLSLKLRFSPVEIGLGKRYPTLLSISWSKPA